MCYPEDCSCADSHPSFPPGTIVVGAPVVVGDALTGCAARSPQ
ncbi:hypothetical protein [Kitasatospora sp. MMS16-BH015]|nr:hypothetical protein [Kitasatospora sp. MMS16-BH015]